METKKLMTKITIPDITVSLNLLLNLSKTHWSAYHRTQKSIVSGLTLYLKSRNIKSVTEYPVKITVRYFVSSRRIDPDNLCSIRKLWMDSLVKSGILKGDSWQFISPPFVDYWEVDKTNPRIEIEVEERRMM